MADTTYHVALRHGSCCGVKILAPISNVDFVESWGDTYFNFSYSVRNVKYGLHKDAKSLGNLPKKSGLLDYSYYNKIKVGMMVLCFVGHDDEIPEGFTVRSENKLGRFCSKVQA